MSSQAVSKAQPVHTVDDGDDEGPYRMQCGLLQGLMNRPARVLASNQVYDLDALNYYLWCRLAAGKELLDPNTRIPISAESVLKNEHVQELPELKAEINLYCSTRHRPLPSPYQCDITVLADMICGKHAAVRDLGYAQLAQLVHGGISRENATAILQYLAAKQPYSGDKNLVNRAMFVVYSTYALLGGVAPGVTFKSQADVALQLGWNGMLPFVVSHLNSTRNPALQLAAAQALALLAASHPDKVRATQLLPAVISLFKQPMDVQLQRAVVHIMDILGWEQPEGHSQRVVDTLRDSVCQLLNSDSEADNQSAISILRVLCIDVDSGAVKQPAAEVMCVERAMVYLLQKRATSAVKHAAVGLLKQLAGSDSSTHASIISGGFLQAFYYLETASDDVLCGAAEVLQAVVHQGMKPAVALMVCKAFSELSRLAARPTASRCKLVAEYVKRVMELAYSGHRQAQPPSPAPATYQSSPQRQYPHCWPAAHQYPQPQPSALHPTYYAPQYMHTYGTPCQ